MGAGIIRGSGRAVVNTSAEGFEQCGDEPGWVDGEHRGRVATSRPSIRKRPGADRVGDGASIGRPDSGRATIPAPRRMGA